MSSAVPPALQVDDQVLQNGFVLLQDGDIASVSTSTSTKSIEKRSAIFGKVLQSFGKWFTLPLRLLFKYTCPAAGEGLEALHFCCVCALTLLLCKALRTRDCTG